MNTFFIVSTVLMIWGIVIVYWIHSQYHLDILVQPAPIPTDAPLISVCIPARNEERNIRACVESAVGQDYPNLEVIVVNDRSTDPTSKILQDLALQFEKLILINGSELPPGWAGKPRALYQAFAASRGEWLCFVDADTFLMKHALSACYTKVLATQADMFTIMTFQVLGSFWEKVVMPMVMTALSVGFNPRKVNDPKKRDAIANGQFILIRRAVYEAVGGHTSVKDQIAEDKAFAEVVKSTGYRLIVADGTSVARTRMYTSLSEIWEGWTKNIYLGLRDQPSLLALGVFATFLCMFVVLFLPVWPWLGFFWYLTGGGSPALGTIFESLMLWAVLIYFRARVAWRLRISGWYSLTTLLGAAIFAAMMFASAWKVLSRKGVTWKGRTYQHA